MSLRTSRREFLKVSLGSGLVSFALPKTALTKSSNERIQHGSIGVAGMGWGEIQQISSHPDVDIVAICDVDIARMARYTLTSNRNLANLADRSLYLCR